MHYSVVYVDMVADLFHCGHVEFLKECKKVCDVLKVGIHNDAAVLSYKRQPVLTMDERIRVVEACKYVDEVIPDAPIVVTQAFLDSHNIQYVMHGDDISQASIEKMYSDITGRLVLIPYTPNISTTMIIERLARRGKFNLP